MRLSQRHSECCVDSFLSLPTCISVDCQWFARSRSATRPAARQHSLPAARICGGEVSLASSSRSSLLHARKRRGRAMRAWIDRTNDGLSGMPADGISLPPKKGGDFGTSRRPGSKVRVHQPRDRAEGGMTACGTKLTSASLHPSLLSRAKLAQRPPALARISLSEGARYQRG